jgi:hypothetical protein
MTKTTSWMLGLALVAGVASAQENGETQRIAVPLASPGEPAVLAVSLLSGGVRVEGYDGEEIVIEATRKDAGGEVEEVDGMYRIPNNTLGLSVEQRGNTVEVDGSWGSNVAAVRIQVPRATSVKLSTISDGVLSVSGVEGNHELSSVNGGIEALEMRGSVIASTTNGDVVVELLRVTPGTPMSFTTWNGDVEVSFPADFGAMLLMKVGQGEILSEFEVAVDPLGARMTREEGARGTRLELESEVRARIGAGGPEIRFETFNGDVRIKKVQG